MSTRDFIRRNIRPKAKPGASLGGRPMRGEGLNVLLVEDNSADANYTREILKEASFPVNLFTVSDGVEALSFIYHQDQYAQAPRPDLILLDLNLPKVEGRDLLEVLKSDDTMHPVPVIIL